MVNYVVWSLVIIMYAPLFYQLYLFQWDKIDYTHAYFILPLSLWLVWRKRKDIKELAQQTHPGRHIGSLIILFTGLIMFVFGWKQEYMFISTLSLVPLLFGLVTYLYGRNMLKPLFFPILYLLLLVPVPLGVLDSITLPMRHGTSVVAEKILVLLNYPIKREGLLLTIGYSEIFMGPPCSGFRSLITMFSLMLTYVYIGSGGFSKKIILTSCIAPFALFGNLIRVVSLCLITFYFGEKVGQGFFHNFSGIVIFVITISGLIGVDSFLDRKLQ
ncbi:MAG: exosortase [Nitrospirae bacterium]|nr:exosortase [Nitrospirota bacterium]